MAGRVAAPTEVPALQRRRGADPAGKTPGAPLPARVAEPARAAFAYDFSRVRVHADSEARELNAAAGARATTFGDAVYLRRPANAADAPDRRLLYHELAHVVQAAPAAGMPAQFVGDDAELDRRADRAATAVDAGLPVDARALGTTVPHPLRQTHADELNPIAGWQTSPESLLLIHAGDRLLVVPGRGIVYMPTDAMQAQAAGARPHFTTDLGTLFGVPAAGAAGTRVFRAGTRTAVILDAGSDPSPGNIVPSVVYMDQLTAVMAGLGLTAVQSIEIIHAHKDHVSEVVNVVRRWNIRPQNLIIPRQSITATRPMQTVVNALQTTAEPALVTLGYGAGYRAGTSLPDRGGPGDVFRYIYRAGDLVIENVALRSALRALGSPGANVDRGSLLTKVTRPSDGATAVVLGDLRGADLELFRNAMEAQRPGAWDDFFAGVTVLSGFSHHVGRLEEGDVGGIMRLLDATLLRTGELRVVEQTNPGKNPAARNDTMELLSRLGATMSATGMPRTANTTSTASATRDTVGASGPDAVTRAPQASVLTDTLGRITRLLSARRTIEAWRPVFADADRATRESIQALIPQIDVALTQLQTASRTAAEAMVRVRSGGTVTAAGGRDYTAATGGARGTAVEVALNAIPATTAAETSIGGEGFRQLEELRRRPESEIPLRVAINAAMLRGEYSDAAFAHMLATLEPSRRDELLTGPRGGPSTRLAAFRRVRAEFGFRSAVLGSGNIMSVPRSFSPAGQVGARGVAGLLVLVELWNDVGAPLVGAVQQSRANFSGANLLPFVRRLLFWQQALVRPKIIGVHDPTFGSPTEETAYEDVVAGLNRRDFDALYFRAPGFDDIDVMRFGLWMTYNVRNFDEYAELFIDSDQDAVRFVSVGDGDWARATWQVRVGRYVTAGENHVEESWFDHPRLTQFMQAYVPRIIANTQRLLAPGNTPEAELGTLDYGTRGGEMTARAHLAPTARRPSHVFVTTRGSKGGRRLDRTIEWWSDPQFIVFGRRGDYVEVSGADYNTHAAIRKLDSLSEDLMTGGYDGRTWTSQQRIGNLDSTVEIHLSQLEADAPYHIPMVAPEGALH